MACSADRSGGQTGQQQQGSVLLLFRSVAAQVGERLGGNGSGTLKGRVMEKKLLMVMLNQFWGINLGSYCGRLGSR
jgi:hypothetical protein